MLKNKDKIVALLSFTLMFSMVTGGCGSKKNQSTEDETVKNGLTVETGSDTDAEQIAITQGSYEGDDTYINDSFGFKMTLPSGKWSFKTAEEIADGTGEEIAVVEGVLNGDISPFTRSISYLAIACNEETGSNVIITYMCPELNQLDTYMTAEEYITLAAEGYDDAKTGKQDFAGETWDYLERTDLTDANQKLFAKSADGIIVMITFTVVDDEDCEDMFSIFK